MGATHVVRARTKGQITIPGEFRKELGIEEDGLLPVRLAARGRDGA